jgi:heme-degrading monooxygenase HmoA
MAQLLVHHKVEDYATWRRVYDELDGLRQSFGMTGSKVFHTSSNPNEIVILTDWPSAEKARAYGQSPDLKQAMQRAGVTSQPEILILEEL